MDWRALEPLSAEGLLTMARVAIRDTRSWVDQTARLSHVGFRSQTPHEWELLKDAMQGQGEVHMTFKADGRKIPFVKLNTPVTVGKDMLDYIELPEPKPTPVDEPLLVVVYQITGENHPPLIRGGYDVREQAMHAKDFIERDKGRF